MYTATGYYPALPFPFTFTVDMKAVDHPKPQRIQRNRAAVHIEDSGVTCCWSKELRAWPTLETSRHGVVSRQSVPLPPPPRSHQCRCTCREAECVGNPGAGHSLLLWQNTSSACSRIRIWKDAPPPFYSICTPRKNMRCLLLDPVRLQHPSRVDLEHHGPRVVEGACGQQLPAGRAPD